jgi:hypothetical protein
MDLDLLMCQSQPVLLSLAGVEGQHEITGRVRVICITLSAKALTSFKAVFVFQRCISKAMDTPFPRLAASRVRICPLDSVQDSVLTLDFLKIVLISCPGLQLNHGIASHQAASEASQLLDSCIGPAGRLVIKTA